MRCPHCGSSRLHRDGYTEKGAAKYHCLNCGRYFNDLTNSVLAFVREVQEIGERHGFLRAWLRKFRGVSKYYLRNYISFFGLLFNSKETWFPSIILFPMV